MTLHTIKFQKYFKQYTINIPLGLLVTVLANADYKSVNNNQTYIAPTDPGTAVLPISVLKKSTEHMNSLLQHQHDVRQHDKKKTKYEKYQVGLMALCNLITSNIEEYFVLAHTNSITWFSLVDPIFLMFFIWTNYGTVLLKQLQDNYISLDAQWDLNTTITVLFNHIEDCKLFAKYGEEPLIEKKEPSLCIYCHQRN